jgi:alpha,alpha-trehalose phosphorylase
MVTSPLPLGPLRFGEDPWKLSVSRADPETCGQEETVFSLSNGWLGVRGSWEQGKPAHEPGTLVNGFHENWPIVYPEAGHGFATVGQTMVYVPEASGLAVSIDGVRLELGAAEIERHLDLRRGVLETRARWPEVRVEWSRLVSLELRSLLAARVQVHVGRPARVEIESIWRNRQDSDYLAGREPDHDPRRAPAFRYPVLSESGFERSEDGLGFDVTYRTLTAGMELRCRCRHRPGPGLELQWEGKQTRWTASLRAGESIRLDKFTLYDLASLPEGIPPYEHLLESQQLHLERFWSDHGVVIEGDLQLQQAINWITFQLHQASVLVEGTGIPAKGLTGQAYEGHCFWDMDVFMLPFVAHTNPGAASNLVRFRQAMLPQARRRASQLSLAGALFPWRTINGEEASAYFEAGTAQYHIDAAVVEGLTTYLETTGDEELLWECGLEMAIETARMWTDLGFFDPEGEFHIHLVTGPDEYSALVDDNAYTNLMAQACLLRTAAWTERLAAEQPERFARLVTQLQLGGDEVSAWRRAAQAMHVPHDPVRGITPQDARFLEHEAWDWTTPEDQYPLLLHFHPLVIYRHQVLKQADVVMAILNLPDRFTPELAAANFRYYDPITTGDSSLSAPVQAAVAAMIGDHDLSDRYLRRAALVDLAGLADNTADGVHLAAAGGVWLALLRGFAGVRMVGEELVIRPCLPPSWSKLAMSIRVRGSRLRIEARPASVTLTLAEGAPVPARVGGQLVEVGPTPVTIPIG